MSESELKILKWCSNLLAFSVMVMIAFPVIVLGAIAVFKGQYELLAEPTFYVVALVGMAYVASAYLLFTIEGKSIRRRVFSWFQSFAFHVLLFLGFAVYLYTINQNLEVLVLLSAELVIGFLSLLGYFYSKQSLGVGHA